MTTIPWEDQLVERPVDPATLDQIKGEMRQYARAYRLREMRLARAMTQIDVAQELGIGQNRVSQIERGDNSDTGSSAGEVFWVRESRWRGTAPVPR